VLLTLSNAECGVVPAQQQSLTQHQLPNGVAGSQHGLQDGTSSECNPRCAQCQVSSQPMPRAYQQPGGSVSAANNSTAVGAAGLKGRQPEHPGCSQLCRGIDGCSSSNTGQGGLGPSGTVRYQRAVPPFPQSWHCFTLQERLIRNGARPQAATLEAAGIVAYRACFCIM
jgi:hypothetical protein